jgi:stearoyl-CoA desaturase (delta-9 desaturase)
MMPDAKQSNHLKPTHNQLVRGLQVINHLAAIVGLIYAVAESQYHYLITAVLFYWVTGVLGINIGMHRLLSHRSFKTYKPFEWLFSFIAVITTVGSPLAWVAIHRQHHRICERPGDPHSPYLLGNWRAWFGLWEIQKLDLKLIRDMRKDRLQRFLHKYYFEIILLYCCALILIDPWLLVFGYAIPACLCLHSTSAIIVIAHRHGYKTYDLKHDQSRNSWIANLITLGEGWHNNHHAKPYAWSNWERWWEWDIPAVIIRFIKK